MTLCIAAVLAGRARMDENKDKAKRLAALEPGAVLGGCRLERPLEAGGMGEVWLARQLSLDRSVAVKVLPGEFARDPAFVERFRREALLAAKVRSPYVVETYDAALERGFAFIIMEFLEGETLQGRIRDGKPLGEVRALHLLLQAARGLQAAHEVGLVHRDVKPANIFLQKKGPAKLLDFGLAQSWGEADSLTEPGVVMGTPHYMSPEQCEGKPATPLSDLYSLGASLYAALTGRPPFIAGSAIAVMRLHLDRDPELLRGVRPDLSVETEELVRSLLAKDPALRPASAQAVAREADRRIHELAGSPLEGTAVRQKPAPSVAPSARRRRVILGLGAVGALAVAAALGSLVFLLARSAPEVRSSEVPSTSTRFLTLSARVLPDGSRGPERGILELTVTPKPGLFLSSAHGESHGHKHRVAEFGIDLVPSGPVKFDRAEVDLPEIRSPYTARVGFSVAPDGRRGKYPVRMVYRYQVMETTSSAFEPDKVEVVAEILYE
jgi:serine/threonine-protein kinase